MALASTLPPCISFHHESSFSVTDSVSFGSISRVTPNIHTCTRICNSSAATSQHICSTSIYSFARSTACTASLADAAVDNSLGTLRQAGPREEFLPPGTLVSLLRDCHSLDAAEEALGIVVQSGLDSDTYVGTNLVQLYSRFNNLPEACRMFNKVEEPNVITWTSVISAHSRLGQEEQGIWLFEKMQESGIEPDGHAVVTVLDACANIAALEEGRQIHEYVVESGLESNIYVGNALVSMYASCGSLEEASTALSRAPNRDVITWSALMRGYAQQGLEQGAFELVKQMYQQGVIPNHVTYVHVLEACLSLDVVLEQGMLAHACIVENGLDEDELVGSALINMYGKNGLLEDAHKVFDGLPQRDDVTWTALISIFAQEDGGHAKTSLKLYEQMQLEGMQLTDVLSLSVLKACAMLTDSEYGNKIHHRIVAGGWDGDVLVSSSMIDMYMKCGKVEDAFHVFGKLSEPNVVTWSSIIAGHVELGYSDVALELFYEMQREGIEPDLTALLCILKACTCVAALEQGKVFHGDIVKKGFEMDEHVGSALIHMYSSCGDLSDAVALFERLQSRNVVVFNALITGYANNNNFTLALETFNTMKECRCKPNAVTFLSLLVACSNLSLVKEGCYLFESMREHGMQPELDHHNTMVDIFGHAGLLRDSEDLLETMPFKANKAGWVSLLSSCGTFKDVVIGRRCFDRVVTIEPLSSVGYVLMSKIYSQVGLQDSASQLEQLRLSLKAWKVPGRSYIEISNEVHMFKVGGGCSHPQTQEIYARLEEVFQELRQDGALWHLSARPGVGMGDDLCDHSEMLAVGFGLINTPKGKTLRITKNLHTCLDCHSVLMFTSKLEERKIVLIDGFCVHEFKHGACTCSSQHFHGGKYR